MAIRAVSFLRILVAVWLLCEVFAQRSANRNNRRLATRKRLRSGEGMWRRDFSAGSYLFQNHIETFWSNTATFNTPLKKYLFSRTQLIPSVLFICIALAMQAESILTFIEKSGKWKANTEVFAILIGYLFLLFEVIADSRPLLSKTRNAREIFYTSKSKRDTLL